MFTGLIVTTGSAVLAQSNPAERRAACLRVLREAMHSADGFFVRVHAAEALVMHHQIEQIDSLFTLSQKNPDQYLGATRVLARLHQYEPAVYERYIDQLTAVFLNSNVSTQRVVALESLGKLGYSQLLAPIQHQADSGATASKAMARWVLSNSGTASSEAQLADLLNSSDPLAYRYAAYAFRHKKSVRPATYALLEACAQRLAPQDPERVYVLSAVWVHASATQAAATKTALLRYQHGAVNERYELAEALNRRGTSADLALLDTLLHDANPDVRVAAASAVLAIDARS